MIAEKYIKRFQKLIKFLERLPPSKFNFTSYFYEVDENECGTVCCAVGWLPKVFPRAKVFKHDVFNLRTDVSETALKWFGLNRTFYRMLFVPGIAQPWNNFNMDRMLNGSASPHQVANEINKYIQWAQTQ